MIDTPRLRALLPLILSVTLLGATPGVIAITSDEKAILQEIRNNIFGGSRLAAAFTQTTISGEEPPIFPLEVSQRGLIVWEIDPANLEAFSQEIGLDPGYSLTPVKPLTVTRSQTQAGRLLRYLEDRGLEQVIGLLFPEKYYVFADVGLTRRAEQGTKLEFKTFVRTPDDVTPRLYRFDSHKALPGVELLQLSSATPAQLELISSADLWQGSLVSPEGSLVWSAPIDIRQPTNPDDPKKQRFSEAFLDAGETVLAPRGLSANYYYDGSSVSGGFKPVTGADVQVDNSFGWSQYTLPDPEVLVPDTLTEYLVQPNSRAIEVTASGAGLCGLPTSDSSQLFANLVGCALIGQDRDQVIDRLFASADRIPGVDLPALYYGVLDLYQGFDILLGVEPPKLFFTLLEEPQTIFINFEIPEQKVTEFEAAFLPDRFRLAKIRLYPEQTQARYMVSLNVYQSRGQNISGYRAEWSTYVINPDEADPKPRFSVLEAQTDVGGFDAVTALERYTPNLDLRSPEGLEQLIEPPSDRFNFTANPFEGIQIELRDFDEQIEVDVSIAYPPASEILTTAPFTEWMEANDFVYWGEVGDILKYDSNVMFAELLVFEARPGDLIRDTTFEGFVNPVPLPIIIWNGPQKIALEPWGNLDGIVPSD